MSLEKIEYEVSIRGLSLEEIAVELGLSLKTLKKKLKKNTIGVLEAEYIAAKIGIDNPGEIFFDAPTT